MTRLCILFLSKLFNQLKTKYANIYAYRSNSHSNHHTKNDDELLILFISVRKQLYVPILIIVPLQIETLVKSLMCQTSQVGLKHNLPYTSQNLFDLECPSVAQFPVCKTIVTRSTSENIQCYVII